MFFGWIMKMLFIGNSMKKILLISLVTTIIGFIFNAKPFWVEFLWSFKIWFLPLMAFVPVIAGMFMVFVQKENKSYKFLPKLIAGALITSFTFSISTQIYECLNYSYAPHCPIANPILLAPFSLLLATVFIYGGLIGILIKGSVVLLVSKK